MPQMIKEKCYAHKRFILIKEKNVLPDFYVPIKRIFLKKVQY